MTPDHLRLNPEAEWLVIQNRTADRLVVALEPWASEYDLEPGNKLEIAELGGDAADAIEVHVEPGRLVLYARSGTTLTAYDRGRELP